MTSPTPGLPRWGFIAAVLMGGTLFWVAKRPPMGDLSQHAAQAEMLRDVFAPGWKWGDLVHLNYFTPYWVPVSAAALLSTFMPVVTALKVVLTIAFFAFVAASIILRRELGGDSRLDWLLLPGFFGFSYHFGFYTFLVAAPLGMVFIVLSRRFAQAPSRLRAALLMGAGVVLFFSHGLVFVFAVGVGGAMALCSDRRHITLRLAPFSALGLLAVAYLISAKVRDPASAGAGPIDWGWGWGIGHRLVDFPLFAVAAYPRDLALLPVVPLLLLVPWLLGDRLQKDRQALMPMAVLLLVWFLAPSSALHIDLLFQRFALFLLPAYVFAFRRSGPQSSTRRARAMEIGLAVLCVAFLGTVLTRAWRFDRESAPFESVLAAAQPGERALSIIFDPSSAASHTPYAYHSYPLWYQAERQGFVDFNFATFLPEVVRFRPGKGPPLPTDVATFDWNAVNASAYRYFFVRHSAALPPHLFDNDQCTVSLVLEAGPWMLFERGACGGTSP